MSRLFFSGLVFQPIWSRKATVCCFKKCGHVPRLSNPRFCSTNGQSTSKPSSRIKWFWMPAGVGFALISFIQLRHIQERERRKYTPLEKEHLEKGMPPWQVNLFKVVPTRTLSRLWGAVHEIELPASLRGPVVRLWTWAFGCCLDEAEEDDPCKYPNLSAFFTRKLKQGVRDIEKISDLVNLRFICYDFCRYYSASYPGAMCCSMACTAFAWVRGRILFMF